MFLVFPELFQICSWNFFKELTDANFNTHLKKNNRENFDALFKVQNRRYKLPFLLKVNLLLISFNIVALIIFIPWLSLFEDTYGVATRGMTSAI